MKILLIKARGLTFQNFHITPPLGLMYLAGYLRETFKNIEVKILDTRVYKNRYKERLAVELKDFEPAMVGISAVTMEAKSMHEIAGMVKEVLPESKVVVGGAHPTSFLRRTLEDRNIDYVVRGEGEETFAELVRVIVEEGEVRKVKGIAYREDGDLVETEPRGYIEDLNTLPFPAWDMINIDDYARFWSMSPRGKRRYMVIYTSRSCPYRCIYCHNIFGKGFRARSPENVIEEIDILYNRYNIKEIEIVDDIFNFDSKRVERICDLIVERGYDLRIAFPNGLRSDLLNNSLLEKMRKAGTVFITFAVESASPRIQRLIKKNLRLDKVKEAIEHAVKLGIFSNGAFMLGFPTETEEEVKETIRFAVESNLHSAYFFIVTPFEGTELFEMVSEEVRRSLHYNEYSYYRTNHQISDVKEGKLFKLWHIAYLKFYLSSLRSIRYVYTMYKNKVSILNIVIMFLHGILMILHRIITPLFRREIQRN